MGGGVQFGIRSDFDEREGCQENSRSHWRASWPARFQTRTQRPIRPLHGDGLGKQIMNNFGKAGRGRAWLGEAWAGKGRATFKIKRGRGGEGQEEKNFGRGGSGRRGAGVRGGGGGIPRQAERRD